MKYLAYSENCKKSPAIVRSVELLDVYFEGHPSIVTSGFRTPTDQMTIILQKMARHGIDTQFPEIQSCLGSGVEHTVHIPEINRDLYWWQRGWSKLLNIGDIVNPPIPAEVIFDYFRPGSTENKKGEVIQLSPHQRGLAFDIGGGTDLTEKAKRVLHSMQSQSCFIRSFLCERINNAVHCDVEQIGGATG